MTHQPDRRVAVVGAGGAVAALTAVGVTDILELDADRVVRSAFDEASSTWSLRTATGEVVRARVVITARDALLVPWVPQLAGRHLFGGLSLSAAGWDPDFDPAGKRIAFIGADSAAGHHIERLARSAAVTVFAYAPRRMVAELPLPSTRATRWLGRRLRPGATGGPPGPTLVRSAISTMTASGIRTRDGVDHPADAVVYGTGFAIGGRVADEALVGAGGSTVRQAWNDSMEPYFGVAVHGFPNYFVLGGPDTGAQARYVAQCVRLLGEGGANRIEVRRSSQQVFNERVYVRAAQPHPVPRAFTLSTGCAREQRESYDGAATLTLAGVPHPVRVRLAGRLDPIDGRYHWQGTVFGSPSQPLPDHALRRARTATLTVGERSAPTRIIEKTPWGTHSIAGVGNPPYPLGGG